MTITTTVTWADLRSAYDDELAELRDAHDELRAKAVDQYGEDALDRPLPSDPALLDEGERDLFVYQQQLEQYDETARTKQERRNLLDRIRDEYGDGTFELKMLTGEETMNIAVKLRQEARDNDLDADIIQIRRNAVATDTATIDAPEGVPREDGSPVPSKAPNTLTAALWDQVERFNSAGATDFRPEGLGERDPAPTPTDVSSATPSPAAKPSSDSAPTDE